MLIIGAQIKSGNSSKYDFKTLKVRPLTYKRLVKIKALIESEEQELHSFDEVVSFILDAIEKK